MANRKNVEPIVSAMGVVTSIVTDLVGLVKKMGGTMESIYRLATPEGKNTLEAVARLIVQQSNQFLKLISEEAVARLIVQQSNQFLKLISDGQELIIDATDGKEILADAKDVFAWIDNDFVNWGANEPGQSTEATSVQVYEMTKDANFNNMFESLGNPENLCLTQAQIKGFVKKHRDWLRTDGYGTFFLFKSNGNMFVADVYVSSDGLYVNVYRFGYSFVWDAEYRHRVVVPQLA